MASKEVASEVGRYLRLQYGAAFGVVCEKGAGTAVLDVPEPRKLARDEWTRVAEALVSAAAADLKIKAPHFSGDDWRHVWSAAGWLCRPGGLCRECKERSVLAPALGGLSIDEFLEGKAKRVA